MWVGYFNFYFIISLYTFSTSIIKIFIVIIIQYTYTNYILIMKWKSICNRSNSQPLYCSYKHKGNESIFSSYLHLSEYLSLAVSWWRKTFPELPFQQNNCMMEQHTIGKHYSKVEENWYLLQWRRVESLLLSFLLSSLSVSCTAGGHNSTNPCVPSLRPM